MVEAIDINLQVTKEQLGLDPDTHAQLLVAERVEAAVKAYTKARDEGPKDAAKAMDNFLRILTRTPGALDALVERERGSERTMRGDGIE